MGIRVLCVVCYPVIVSRCFHTARWRVKGGQGARGAVVGRRQLHRPSGIRPCGGDLLGFEEGGEGGQ